MGSFLFYNIIFIILFSFISFSQTIRNEVLIDPKLVDKNAIQKHHFGVFFEYLYYKVNGKYGVSAQEIQDRGFDTERWGMDWEKHQYWFLFHTCSKDSLVEMKPWYKGYNKKGLRHYAIRKNTSYGEAGFEQEIILDSGKIYDFYVYAMGTVDSVYLRFVDRSGKTIYENNLGYFPKDWKWHKLKCTIPSFPKHQNCKIQIFAKSSGELHLDESSLIATDNQYNLRKEFVDMIRELKPGLMRFPGGSFCDYTTWRFHEHIGDKDQRRAPNYWPYDIEIQRMDFSLDEFFQMCKDLDIEPYITTNYKSGTIQEALDLLEYCNGDTNTIWGKKRALNGNVEPMKVKYFEIGNEQWEIFSPEYPIKYLDYYKAMKKKDTTIKILVNGYHWDGEKEINRIFKSVKDKADYYSWHPGYTSFPSDKLNEIDEYNTFAYGSMQTQLDIDAMMKSLRNYSPHILQAPTEYWTQFMDLTDWITDTAWKGSTLLSGIGDINFLHTFVRNWETTGPACRTLFLTFIFIDSTKDGRRVIYASPGFYALKMFFNNSGKDLVPTKIVSSEKQYAPSGSVVNYFNGAPIFDIVTTKSDDSIYVAILNRSREKSTTLFVNIPGFKFGSKVRFLQLYSNSYYDRNSADEPFKVKPIEFIDKLDSTVTLPKHSYTIIAIPINSIDTTIGNVYSKDELVKIYPNPTSNYIYINSLEDTIEYVYVNDLLGNTILSYPKIMKNKFELNLIDIPYGLYILKLSLSSGQQFCFKVIKTD